ncbi:hypothetical protein niasHT_005591 [Heterodera trifolii]|uniref:Reverse transcriptase RNase H-like domain-containing protein n=1 Tax=Heterodera trifolii TaxID=157864 RepID=A0ABD2M3N4_9BILA
MELARQSASHIFPDKSERVIKHGSCTFNAAQHNYSQIEKEALGLVFAVEKFHRMLYGRKFTLLTDHKFVSKRRRPVATNCQLPTAQRRHFDRQYLRQNRLLFVFQAKVEQLPIRPKKLLITRKRTKSFNKSANSQAKDGHKNAQTMI